jgi:hypothetical protein
MSPYLENTQYTYTQKKRAGGVVQVIDCLTSKHETLSSNPPKKLPKKKKTLSIPTLSIIHMNHRILFST